MLRYGILLGLAGCFSLVPISVHADDVLKNDNPDHLNLDSSWVGGTAPDVGDVAVWDSTVSALNTTNSLGGDVSWAGLKIVDPGGATVALRSGGTLMIGPSGIDMSAATQNLSLWNAVSLDDTQTWNVTDGRTLTSTGGVDGVGHDLILSGKGVKNFRWPISNVNAFTVDDGVVNFYQNSASTFSNLFVRNGGELQVGNNDTVNQITIAGMTTLSNGVVAVDSRGTLVTTGATLMNGGVLKIDTYGAQNKVLTVGSDGIVIHQPETGAYTPLSLGNWSSSNRRGTFNLNGDLSLIAHTGNTQSVIFESTPQTFTMGDGLVTWSGARMFDIGDGGAAIDFSMEPRITGSGSLIKTGAGVMELVGVASNSYSGGTIVSNGALLVNNTMGSGTGSGAVTVEDGTTFGGAGSLTGTVTILDGATLAPGNPVGMFSTGALMLNDASALEFDLGAPWQYVDENSLPTPNDLVRVNGDLTLDGVLTINEQFGFGLGTYTLITYTGTLVDNGLAVGPMSGMFSGTILIDEAHGLVHLLVTGEAPQVLTAPTVTAITEDGATLGATIVDDGGDPIAQRGTVWGLAPAPMGGALNEGGTGTGVFSHVRSGMPSGTLIYFRGYADNGDGRGYSPDGSFRTLSPVPSTHAGDFAAVTESSSIIELLWRRVGNAAGYVVVMRENATPTGVPDDATAYEVGDALGDGIVAAVILDGTTEYARITGLTSETTYHFLIYAYGYDGANEDTYNYKTDGTVPTANATTGEGGLPIVKADNTADLYLGSSWVGGQAPALWEVATWEETVTSANTTLLGTNVSWLGMQITSPGGLVTIDGAHTLTMGASGIDMSAATQSLRLQNMIVLGTSQTWAVTSGATLTIAGGLEAGGYDLSLSGAGNKTISAHPLTSVNQLVLEGNVSFNEYTSTTVSNLLVQNGTISVAGSGSKLIITESAILSNANASVQFGNRAAWDSEALTLINGAYLQINGVGGGNTAIRIGSGGLTIYQPDADPYTAFNMLNTASRYAVYTLDGDVTVMGAPGNSNAVVIGSNEAMGNGGDGYITWSGARTFNVGDGGGAVDLLIEPRLYGSGSLVKSGPGVLSLIGMGTNTYTGGTIISNGTLLINNRDGSGTGSGAVWVEAGSTLGGTGLISGAVTVADAATLAPGASQGMLTLGSLTINNAGLLAFELSAPWEYMDQNSLPSPNDLVRVNGDLVLDGQLTVTAASGFATGTYTVFTYTGTLTDQGLTVTQMPSGFAGEIVVDEINQRVQLEVTSEGGGGTPAEPDVTQIRMLSGHQIGVGIDTEIGVDYALEYTKDLAAVPVVWQEAATAIGDGNPTDLTDSDSADPMRIYRVVAE